MFKKIVVTLSILTTICLIGLGLSVISPQAETVDNFKVHVDVICEDEITKSLIESHIKRELRALKDVDIIPPNHSTLATYILVLVVLEPTFAANGGKTGIIAIAFNFNERFSAREELLPHLRKLFPKPAELLDDHLLKELMVWDIRRSLTGPIPVYNHYVGVAVDDTINVPHWCVSIVASFDTIVLEKARERQ